MASYIVHTYLVHCCFQFKRILKNLHPEYKEMSIIVDDLIKRDNFLVCDTPVLIGTVIGFLTILERAGEQFKNVSTIVIEDAGKTVYGKYACSEKGSRLPLYVKVKLIS